MRCCALPATSPGLPSTTIPCFFFDVQAVESAVETAVETAVENALLDRSFDIRANVRG